MNIEGVIKKTAEQIDALAHTLADEPPRGHKEVERLRGGVADIANAAARLVEITQNLEVKEEFGGEESYWTLYRLFCIDEKRGIVASIDEIWGLLEKNYDMRAETHDSVVETLLEWSEDFETDALEKNVRGTFREADSGGFVFIEYAQPRVPVKARPKAVPMHKEPPARLNEEPIAPTPEQGPLVVEAPDSTTLEEAGAATERYSVHVLARLRSAHEPIKQADIRKSLERDYPELTGNPSLQLLHALASCGLIFACKPRGMSKYYACSEEVADDFLRKKSKSPEETPASRDEEPIDPGATARIIDLMIAPGTHFNQTYTPDQVANAAGVDGNTAKAILRALSRVGLLRQVKVPKNKGGHRSSSQETMKFGLADQKVKEQLVAARDGSGLVGLMRDIVGQQ